MAFEAVSPTSVGKTYIYESAPKPNQPFNVLYKTDGLGNSSPNTGFFLYFVQGQLQSVDINFADTIPNRVYSVNTNNINNSDLWLYAVDSNGNLTIARPSFNSQPNLLVNGPFTIPPGMGGQGHMTWPAIVAYTPKPADASAPAAIGA